MRKNYFYASVAFAIVSVVVFLIGMVYGFTSEYFYFAKPITIFQYTAFLAFALFVTSFTEKLRTSPRLDIYLIIGFLVIMASFYEVLFNFFYWFSLFNFYGLGTDLDTLKNLVPYNMLFNQTAAEVLQKSGLYPVNLNFASKISVLIFFCSVYWTYLTFSLKRNRNIEK